MSYPLLLMPYGLKQTHVNTPTHTNMHTQSYACLYTCIGTYIQSSIKNISIYVWLRGDNDGIVRLQVKMWLLYSNIYCKKT